MAGGLKVGSVYVSVGARLNLGPVATAVRQTVNSVSRGMDKVLKVVQHVGGQLNSIGRRINIAAVAINAFVALAVRAASSSNAAVGAQTKRISDASQAILASLGSALLPTLKQFADELGRIYNWFQSLSPAQREHIAETLKMAGAFALAASVIGRTAGILSSLAGITRQMLPILGSIASGAVAAGGAILDGIGGAFAAITAPITGTVALIAAAVAAIIGVGVLVYEAWTHDWGGIQEKVAAVVAWIDAAVSAVWTDIKAGTKATFSAIGKYIVDPFVQSFEWIRDTFFKGIFALLDSLSSALTSNPTLAKIAGFYGLDQGALDTLKSITASTQHLFTADGVKEIAGQVATMGEAVGGAIKSGVVAGAHDVAGLATSAFSRLKSILPDFSKFSSVVPSSAVPGSGAGENIEFGSSNDILGADFIRSLSQVTAGAGLAANAISGMAAAHARELTQLQRSLKGQDDLKERLADVAELYQQGRISSSTYFSELIKYLDQTSESFKLVHEAANTLTSDLTEGFVNLANGVQGAFGQMVQSILTDLERLVANKVFQEILNYGLDALASAFSGGLGGGAASGVPDVVGGGLASYVPTSSVASALGPTMLTAPVTVNVTVHQGGQASLAVSGGDTSVHMRQYATALGSVVRKHIQEQMRPGGDLYNFVRG